MAQHNTRLRVELVQAEVQCGVDEAETVRVRDADVAAAGHELHLVAEDVEDGEALVRVRGCKGSLGRRGCGGGGGGGDATRCGVRVSGAALAHAGEELQSERQEIVCWRGEHGSELLPAGAALRPFSLQRQRRT